MDQVIQQFLACFERSIHSVHPQWQIIDQLAAEGNTTMLYKLGVAMEAHAEELQPKLWAVESVYTYLERVLALTPGMSYAHTLMELSLLPRAGTMRFPRSLDYRGRMLAPLLASAQNTDVLLDLIKTYRQDHTYAEFMCILVQEMVLRGISCDEILLLTNFFDQMRTLHRPLAWLPLRLLAIEHGLPLPAYSIAGSAFYPPQIVGTAPSEAKTSSFPEGGVKVTLEESTTDVERERILATVAPWSNARMEARAFALDPAIASSHISGRLLFSLNLACLEGASVHDIYVGVFSPQDVFRLLFAAASQGGAYDNGQFGAYGRLATWYTLAGLVGAPTVVSVEEVATLTEQSGWFSFGAESKWFYRAAPMWDLSMLALRSDGKSLAVLAATSTD